MRRHKIIQAILIVCIVSINVYSIISGIIYESFLGILLAVGSIAALVICVHLLKKLEQLNKED